MAYFYPAGNRTTTPRLFTT